jgi:hypothetical protein
LKLNFKLKVGAVGYFPKIFRFLSSATGKIIRIDSETEEYIRDKNGFCIECKPNEVGEYIVKVTNDAVGGGGTFAGYTDDAVSTL